MLIKMAAIPGDRLICTQSKRKTKCEALCTDRLGCRFKLPVHIAKLHHTPVLGYPLSPTSSPLTQALLPCLLLSSCDTAVHIHNLKNYDGHRLVPSTHPIFLLLLLCF